MPPIPQHLADFRVWGGPGNVEDFGVATVELPSFEAMTEDVSGAGIAGVIASPVAGHFGSQMVKVSFRTVTAQLLARMHASYQVLDIRGAIQQQEGTSGVNTFIPLQVDCRGLTKNVNMGRLEVGKVMGAELDLEISFIQIKMAGVELILLDKLNSIYRVSGVDLLATQRAAVGGV